MSENRSGEWYVSKSRYGPVVHAKLGIAQENSGKLVARVKKAAHEIAEDMKLDYVIVDGPPGIGCPVISSLSGADLAVIVTEPTLSGIHDMERIADLTSHFSIASKVVINKYDINLKNTADIARICERRNIEVIAELPFSEAVIKSLVKCVPVIEYGDDEITGSILNLWGKIK